MKKLIFLLAAAALFVACKPDKPETPAAIRVASVAVTPAILALEVGETEVLTAEVLPENAANKSVTWETSDPKIATVSPAGQVTAIAAGTATITATADEKSDTSSVTVTEPEEPEDPEDPEDPTDPTDPEDPTEGVDVQSIILYRTGESITRVLPLDEGQTEKLTATITPENATDKTLTWASSDETIATVDQEGKVTAIAQGTAKIIATATTPKANPAQAELTVNVYAPETPQPAAPTEHAIELVVNVNANGTATVKNALNEDITTFIAGSAIHLSATPNANHLFEKWEITYIDAHGDPQIETITDAQTTYTTPAFDLTIYAYFIPDPALLAFGKAGDLDWTLTTAGTLTISGTGPMPDYNSPGWGAVAPWINFDISDSGRNSDYGEEIRSVVIAEGVTHIGSYAFDGASEHYQQGSLGHYDNLESVTIPASVKNVGPYVFVDCDALGAVTFPGDIESIGTNAFFTCTNLTSVTFSGEVGHIREEAFYACVSLANVYLHDPTPPSLDSRNFYSTYDYYDTLHVPAGSLDAYNNIPEWRDVFTTILDDL
ncbi:MAG: Ig-like domain-containing protein [Alistipes sp.]|nr:Ig-like domain-containing protein [Alistipes sp.]